MFKLFNRIASTVAETVAPLIRSHVEQLQHTWRKIDEEYGAILQSRDDALDDPTVIDASKLSDHFAALVQVLIAEEADSHASNAHASNTISHHDHHEQDLHSAVLDQTVMTSPCIEYFLKHGLFDRLCALGLSDRPPGIRRLVTKTLDALLTALQHPLLPNMSVHLALRQFISVCFSHGDLSNKKGRATFVSLLCTICFKLRDDPSLAGVFLQAPPSEIRASDEAPSQSEMLPSEFLVFTALLSLLNAEHEDGLAAREGLLCCLQLPVPAVAQFIVDKTFFCEQMVFGLRDRYEKLPTNLALYAAPEFQVHLRSFERWLSLINTVVQSSYPLVAEKLCDVILADFLKELLLPVLLDKSSEDSDNMTTVIAATSLLRRLVEQFDALLLQRMLIKFILDDTTVVEANDSTTSLCSVFISRMTCKNQDVALHTLHLFESLIATRDMEVLHVLSIAPLESGMHLQSESRQSILSQSEPSHVHIKDIMSPFVATIKPSLSMLEPYLVDAQVEEQQWLHAWDFSSPANRAALTDSISASPMKSRLASSSLLSSSPSSLISTENPVDFSNNSSNVDEDKPFFEGPFLQALFDLLSQLHSNSFLINLTLTSVLSKLAYCPDPLLHCYLIDPTCPLKPGVRTLHQIMITLYNTATSRAADLPNHKERLDQMKHALNNQGAALELGVTESDISTAHFLQAEIVFEEFLKEILAISQAKYNLSTTAAKLALQSRTLQQQSSSVSISATSTLIEQAPSADIPAPASVDNDETTSQE